MSDAETPFDVVEEETAVEDSEEPEAGDEDPQGKDAEDEAVDDEDDAEGGPPGGGPLSVALGEAPDLGEAAEIVVIGTSLGSIKRQFFSSRRVQHFLDCKGVVYFMIDCNRDLSSAMNLKDVDLFKEWKAQGILRTFDNPTSESGEPEVELPQVLVDGVVLGGEADLQELEEDGDLDVQASGAVQQMLQGYVYNEAAEAAADSKLKERWASGLQQADFEWGDDKREDAERPEDA